jgi:hypothetical protein
MGARHFGLANVVYMEGHVTADNQWHNPRFNLSYDGTTQTIHGDQWRVVAFADAIWNVADIGQQHHFMPVLNVRGWEWFFNATSR